MCYQINQKVFDKFRVNISYQNKSERYKDNSQFQLKYYYFFNTCGPNRTQVCSHIIDYIPVPIGLVFAIAPTHDRNGNGATQTCTWKTHDENTGPMCHHASGEQLKFVYDNTS